MRRITLVILLALITFGLGAVPALANDSATPTPIPWFDEPDPICGSSLHLDGIACAAASEPFVVHRGWTCPDLSEARFLGVVYQHPVPYDDAISGATPVQQSIENNAQWFRFCTIDPADIVDLGVRLPVVPSPQPSVICPEGTEGVALFGVTSCVASETSTPAPTAAPVAIPLSTPTVDELAFTGASTSSLLFVAGFMIAAGGGVLNLRRKVEDDL